MSLLDRWLRPAGEMSPNVSTMFPRKNTLSGAGILAIPSNVSNVSSPQCPREKLQLLHRYQEGFLNRVLNPKNLDSRKNGDIGDIGHLASKSAGFNVEIAGDILETFGDTSGVIHDFETRNPACDLEDAGAWRYAEDPATEILTFVYRDPDGDAWLWTPAHGRCERLVALAADPAVLFVCFGDFEIAVWDRIMVPRFGFPAIPIARWVNVRATCSYLTLPGALDAALKVIGAKVVKDTEGRKLVLSLSRLDRKTGLPPEVTPQKRARQYMAQRLKAP